MYFHYYLLLAKVDVINLNKFEMVNFLPKWCFIFKVDWNQKGFSREFKDYEKSPMYLHCSLHSIIYVLLWKEIILQLKKAKSPKSQHFLGRKATVLQLLPSNDWLNAVSTVFSHSARQWIAHLLWYFLHLTIKIKCSYNIFQYAVYICIDLKNSVCYLKILFLNLLVKEFIFFLPIQFHYFSSFFLKA